MTDEISPFIIGALLGVPLSIVIFAVFHKELMSLAVRMADLLIPPPSPPPNPIATIEERIHAYLSLRDRVPPKALVDRLLFAAKEIYEKEWAYPELPTEETARERARQAYQDKLRHKPLFLDTLETAIISFINGLPAPVFQTRNTTAPFSIPLSLLFTDDKALLPLIFPFNEPPVIDARLFTHLRSALDRNYFDPKKDTLSSYYRASVYRTPLQGLFDTPIPFIVPLKTRFEHTVITAGTGAGKTSLIENLLLEDFKTDTSIVVIDSQSELIDRLTHLALLKDKNLIILDPKDNPALNVFDLKISRYSETEQDQIFNQTLEVFNYLFHSLLGADLTVRQATLFNYLISLMLTLPKAMGRNATLLDLIYLTEDLTPYRPAISALEPISQRFFLNDFSEKAYGPTKEQIRYRLQAILGNKTLSRLFLEPENKIDFFSELNRPDTVILIDTNKAFLGAKNSSYLGKIAITLILTAILQRTTAKTKQPTLVYIDEASEYFDRSIDSFLTEARKHHAGLILAHQYLGQLTPELRASVMSQTSTKFASGLSAQDAKALAPDFRAESEFLLAQKPLRFACYVRGLTSKAIPLSVIPGRLPQEDQLSPEEYRALRDRNRARVTASYPEPMPRILRAAEPSTDPFNIDTTPSEKL